MQVKINIFITGEAVSKHPVIKMFASVQGIQMQVFKNRRTIMFSTILAAYKWFKVVKIWKEEGKNQ